MENILELKDLNKQFTDFRLKDVSFSLPAGSIMGFIGENGAGKSTTIKLILNLLRPDSGSINVFGQDYRAHESEIKERIGLVFDENNFPEYMGPKDVDKVMRHVYKGWDRDMFFGYVKRFSLPLDKTVKEYSRGMRMKLAIAVALSHNARILLLDEATSGLDPLVRDEILDIFLEFIQQEDRSILVSSHIVGDLEKVADYITFIHQGRIVFSSPTYELKERYGLLRCTAQQLETLEQEAVYGCRKSAFGVEALVDWQKAGGFELEPASIEDIMLYTIRGEKL